MPRLNLVGTCGLSMLALLVGCGGGGGGGSSADGGAQVLNSGLAIAANYGSGLAQLNGLVFALVNELEQGAQDLNGDGDTADDVVHMIDPVTGIVTNLGVSGTPLFAANDNLLAWGMEEVDEGVVDFSGDGDFGDTVLVFFDPTLPVSATNPRITNVSLEPVVGIRGDGSKFVVVTNEQTAQQDLNGDGVLDDFVLQVLDPITLVTTSSGFAINPMQVGFNLAFGRAAFEVSEAGQTDGMGAATDLNLDGDGSDDVLMVMNVSTGVVVGVGPGGIPRAVAPGAFLIAGTALDPYVLYAIEEADEGATNLNAGISNDADTMDQVAAIFRLNTATETLPGTGLAVQPSRIRGSATRAVFSATEAGNGPTGADYNVDGDRTDFVPFWVDLAVPGTANNVGVAQDDGASLPQPFVCGNHMVILAKEADQGPNGTNYNQATGDTDTQDLVPFCDSMLTPNTQPVNLALAGDQVTCSEKYGDFVVMIAKEADNGGIDFNQDNDNTDEQVFYFRVVADQIASPALRVDAGSGNISIQDCPNSIRLISFTPESASPSVGDMNQDGDFDDYCIISTQIAKANGAFLGASVLGTVATSVATSQFPVLIGDTGAVFPTAEATIGVGRNLNAGSGDLDRFDTVLHVVAFDCP